MHVRKKLLILLLLGCALVVQSAVAATLVAASNAPSKAGAAYICDGSSDQVEINAALARGGEVILSEGTFNTVGTVYVKSGNILTGAGQDKTIIRMSGNYDARIDIAQPTVKVQDLTITQRGWLMITTCHVVVEDVTIRDSKKEAPTVNGMFFVWASGRVCEDIAFIRCTAQDVGSTGFNLNGEKSPRENRNIRFEGCKAIRCGNPGSGKIWAVGFDFHEGADLYDLQVNNCYAEDNWESGFYFEPNFYNGEDPNTAIPVQVNSKVSNCIAKNNGWRNDLSTRFYLTGYYLSCGVTLTDCQSINNRNNGFWVWQGAKDVIMTRCVDNGSDKSFQLRTGTNLRLTDCTAANPRTYALYMWGTSGAVISNLAITNPKKTSGAVSLGLREDHPNDPWPVTGCTIDIKLTGADPNTLIRYYNAKNNYITINGFVGVPPPPPPTVTTTPTPPPTSPTPSVPTPTPTPTVPGQLPPEVGKGVIPGTIQAEHFDPVEGTGYHDTEMENKGGAYRTSEGVDIEYSEAAGSYTLGWMRSGEWLRYTANVEKAGTYNVAFKVATPNAGTTFTFYVDEKNPVTVTVPNTGDWAKYSTVTKQVTLTAGKHVLKISTTGYHNLDSMTFTDPTVTTTPTPTPSTPTPPPPASGAAIPGLIEAENFNTGGENVAYHDTTTANEGGEYRTTEGVDIEMASGEGSHVVGWVRPGEWLKYSVNVTEGTLYDVSFRVSSPQSDASFRMQVDGKDVCTVMVPNTGSYLSYTTVVQQVSLPAGAHVVRLYFNGYTNVNWFKFAPTIRTTTTTPTPTPTTQVTLDQGFFPPPPVPEHYGTGIVPGVIQAEDFNNDGAGVSYYDTTSSNLGSAYRTGEDVDIELCDGVSTPVVCWIRPGEWLKYTVNVRWTGDYDVTFRVSSPEASKQVRLQIDGVTATTFTVPNTGSYETYTNVTQRVRMTGGPHMLRLLFGGGYHNIDYMSFATVGTLTSARTADAVLTANTTVPATVATLANATVTTAVPTTVTANATTAAPTATVPATQATATPNATGTATVTATATSTGAPAPAIPVPAMPTETATAAPTATTTADATPAPTGPTPQATAGIPTPAPDTTPAPTETAPSTPTPTVTVIPTETVAATQTVAAIVTVLPTETTAAPLESLLQTAAADRNLSTFVEAARASGLEATLDGDGPFTVLAPTDEAFAALPAGTLEALLENRTLLEAVLGHHVAAGELDVANLSAAREIRMLEGEPVPVTVGLDGRLLLGGATVNATDIRAGNGVIHVIDAVLLPPGAVPTPTPVAPAPSTLVADPTPMGSGTAVARPDLGTPAASPATTNGTPAP